MSIQLLHFTVQQKLIQHCKAITKSEVKVLQFYPTLCNPMDCSPPGTCVHGILQARILEWVVIPFSRGSFQPTDRTNPGSPTMQADYLPSEPPGKPSYTPVKKK